MCATPMSAVLQPGKASSIDRQLRVKHSVSQATWDTRAAGSVKDKAVTEKGRRVEIWETE